MVPTKSSAGPGAEWWDTADCTVEHEPSGGVVATGDYEESIRTTPSAGVEGRDDVGAVTSKEGAQSKTTAGENSKGALATVISTVWMAPNTTH